MLEFVASVALATVFVVSGFAKLTDVTGTREAVTGFGVPSRLVAVVAALLAPLELAVAVLLLVPATTVLGLLSAVALLSAFSLAVLVNLRAGRRPECRCFGRLGGADVSGRTVGRNAVLVTIAVAGIAAVLAGVDRPDGAAAVLSVMAGLALAAGVLAAELLAGRAARQARDEADEATFDQVNRVELPDFRLPTPDGDEVAVRDLLAPGRPLLLVTLSPGCGPCRSLRPDVAQWAQVLASEVTVAVLATGTPESNTTSYADHPHLPVLVDVADLRSRLGTTATPSAVLIDPHGTVSSGVANGEPLVRRLLVSVLTGTEAAPEEPADDDVEGMAADEIDLGTQVGRRAAVTEHQLDGSTVLLDAATGATVVLDPLGALVWQVLDGSPLQDVVTDLAEVFGAPTEQVGPDVLALVRSLGAAGLLAGVRPKLGQSGRPEHTHVHAEAG